MLDLGCGQGRDALLFARAGHRLLGVDVSSVGIEQMRATAGEHQSRAIRASYSLDSSQQVIPSLVSGINTRFFMGLPVPGSRGRPSPDAMTSATRLGSSFTESSCGT